MTALMEGATKKLCDAYVKSANCHVGALEKETNAESSTTSEPAAGTDKKVDENTNKQEDLQQNPAPTQGDQQDPAPSSGGSTRVRRNLQGESKLADVRKICTDNFASQKEALDEVEGCKDLCEQISFGTKAAAALPLFLT